mmetsp:Transcript_21595/g.60015  ORF Transcript_21595/g.60015 Transcript_21595/m.60015 type:complete len:298 (-) Transcript_21595:150-1043(-)|eukprot:CAMPEP_0117649880 /NCGR_PEP_ID=MMETSP0804-20121206/1232_1 /TAXON_ID=1074897 /ORGANISM="Tetraselmis astigmatica, Strain CCMP880" /LENGTH=297 /DNA_ID=CAMNT_0005455695 /DNA_START=86 /DNA_END=979 /DNA_ORIENTATION=-
MAGQSTASGIPQRYLMFLEYNGTGFLGWQRQPKGRTVQGTLEDALSKFMGGATIKTSGSSRTDTGVHAIENSCHVDLLRTSRKGNSEVEPYAPETVMCAANHFLFRLGGDVQIVRCHAVSEDVHARFNACERTYIYRIFASNTLPSVFERGRLWHVKTDIPLDITAMGAAARKLEGEHDFSSFRAAGCSATSPVRTLDELTVRCAPGGNHGGIPWMASGSSGNNVSQQITITARSRSFLYHQVRLLVGALHAVGSGTLSPQQIESILEKRDIAALTTKMAPPDGLYLAKVCYSQEFV